MTTTVHAEISSDGTHLVLLAAGGGDHEVAIAAKRLGTLTPLFKPSDPPGALVVPLTWAAVVQLQATYGDAQGAMPGASWWPGPRLCDWITEQIAARTGALPTELPAHLPMPEGLTARPYQVAGAWEIARTGRTLIFDEPRTGKTITAIIGLAIAAGEGQREGLPVVVVCPASVVDPWVKAFNTWAPYWRAVAWRGSKRQALAGTAEVYVASYDTVRIDAASMGKAPLMDLGARSVVIDESHYIKNHTAHRTRAVRRLARHATHVVALSGTPITHHPGDLWPALACLEEPAWPAKERWINRYCTVLAGDYKDEILGLAPHAEREFRLTLLGQHRRVARADVMSQLPPKVYSERTVDLPAKWRKAYDDFEAQMLAELPDGDELSVFDTLSVLTHLSSLACSAADVRVEYGPDVDERTGEPKRHVHLDLKDPSWKVDALLEILGERCGDNGGDQVVAFAPSAQLMRLAGAAAAKAGYSVGYVIGGQPARERTETIERFQAGGLDLICATTGAGGEGITLSAAGTLVFLQRPWSLVKSLQAEDRAEGDFNATRGTEVIDVIARNTIDTRVRAVLRERAGQLADLVQDPRIVTELLGGTGARATSPLRSASSAADNPSTPERKAS